MSMINDIDKIIKDITSVLGKPIENKKFRIIDRGIPHKPESLPPGTMGIYAFSYNGEALKIGKAGSNSNARFLSQHYNPKSAQSTLAASILMDERMQNLEIDEDNIKQWIKNNCRRVDVLFDSDLSIFTLELIEAALHYTYEPRYEGFSSQRKTK